MCGANARQRQEAASKEEGINLQALGLPVLLPPVGTVGLWHLDLLFTQKLAHAALR